MAGVYISYPFCAQKCTYCNFASGVFPEETGRRYLSALREEIAAFPWQWRPETVYLGGGTPSALDPCDLEPLLSAIPGRPWPEATIEAAPGTITPEQAVAWLELGLNRVSLGVQSFVPSELARTGRRHSAEVVESEIALLRSAGLGNINVDLIAGLPGQTPESWEQALGWIARLRPPHVSVYMLEVDDDSRLGREVLNGGDRFGAAQLPSEEWTAGFYERAVAQLARLGLRRYEISNFAEPGFESRHNLKYWRLEPYAGFGADAHSFDGLQRWRTPESVREYLESPGRVAAEPGRADERLFLGLRLSEGVRLRPAEREQFAAPLQRFLREGLLETKGDLVRLTNRGVLLSNEVFQELLIP